MSIRGSEPQVVAVFGGSFDPPHIAHVLVIPYVLSLGLADRVIVAPCAVHPFGKAMRPFAERLELARSAFEAFADRVEVTDLEDALLRRNGAPNYTIALLEAIAADNRDARVRLLIGSDVLGEVHRWHRWEEIERDYGVIVVPRAEHGGVASGALPNISSREIRAAIDRGDQAFVRAHVPRAVCERLWAGPRQKVWLIGSGHVATHAIRWLAQRRVDPIAIGARGLARSEPLPSAAPDAVWILVRDNAIAEVTGRLVHIAGLPASIPILHAAGARVAADVLQAASAAGHPVGTAHPICSLRTERPWPSHLGSAGFGIEGDDAARAMALSWIDGQPWIDLQGLSAADRQRYHAACSLAANHLAVLLRASADILQRYGATKQAGERMIGSLLRSALSNLLCLGIPEGITGPVARGDGQAVADHIAALEPEDAELYRVLSARLAAIVDQGRRGP